MPVGTLDRFHFGDLGAERAEVAREVRARPECATGREPSHLRRAAGSAGTGDVNRAVARRAVVRPRRGAGRTGRTGVFDSRNGAPGRRNDQPSPPALHEEPAIAVLRTVHDGCAVVDRSGRNA